MTSTENPKWQPPIINHVPTHDELVRANELGSQDASEHAVPRADIEAIARGMGYVADARTVSTTATPSRELPVTPDRTTPSEPFIESDIERRLSGEEAAELRRAYQERQHPSNPSQ